MEGQQGAIDVANGGEKRPAERRNMVPSEPESNILVAIRVRPLN